MNNSMPYYLSWVGLLGVISAQTLVLFNQETLSLWHVFILLLALFPIKGFLQNKRYTFQWAGFLSLFFLIVGVSGFFEAANANSTSFILLCSSVILYFGVVFHAKKLAYHDALKKANPQESL